MFTSVRWTVRQLIIIHILWNPVSKHCYLGEGHLFVAFTLEKSMIIIDSVDKAYLIRPSLSFYSIANQDVRDTHNDELNPFSCKWQINDVCLMICFYSYPVLIQACVEFSRSNANLCSYQIYVWVICPP